jgi:hypothetical protein
VDPCIVQPFFKLSDQDSEPNKIRPDPQRDAMVRRIFAEMLTDFLLKMSWAELQNNKQYKHNIKILHALV